MSTVNFVWKKGAKSLKAGKCMNIHIPHSTHKVILVNVTMYYDLFSTARQGCKKCPWNMVKNRV